jgi:GNAT superfamily N-acetyltransferase
MAGGGLTSTEGIRLRPVGSSEDDLAFLREMLFEAVAWRPDRFRPDVEAVVANPEISRYVDDWGRAGDQGLVAETESGDKLGAAWYRLFTHDDHGYGFFSPSVPEVTVGVSPSARSRGIGTGLLTTLIDKARQAGYPALSLSVERDNAAVRLYERLGFVRVGRTGNAWTMTLDLRD